jgi:dimeric dUTPase (all-alpha-NTP-PPase superfamily)
MNKDKFEHMFEMQKKLNQRIGVDTDSFDKDEQIKWVLNYTRALSQEVAELIDSVPWKWWAKYQEFDQHNAKVEVVDIFHFLISLAQTLGLTADDIYQSYLNKNKVNFERQDSGYTAKSEDDNAGI